MRVESRQFREISYEVATVEYAIALPSEKLEKNEYYQASDALFEARDAIDRVITRLVETLYR